MTTAPDVAPRLGFGATPHTAPAAPPRTLARRMVFGVIAGACLANLLARALPAGLTYTVTAVGAALGLILGAAAAHRPRLSKPALGAGLGLLAGYLAHPVYPIMSTLNAITYLRSDSFDFGYGPAFSMLLGAGIGAVTGAFVERRPRLASPLLGVVLGGLGGHLAEFACRAGNAAVYYDSSIQRFAGRATSTAVPDGYQQLAWVAVGSALGLLLGLVVRRRPRWTAVPLGLALGVVAGSVGSATSRTSFAAFDGADRMIFSGFASDNVAGCPPMVWIAVAAALGQFLGALAIRFQPLVRPWSGLAIGAFGGFALFLGARSADGNEYEFSDGLDAAAVFSETSVGYVLRGHEPIFGMAVGAAVGLIIGARAFRRFRPAVSRLGLAAGSAAGFQVATAYMYIWSFRAAPSAPTGYFYTDYVPFIILAVGMLAGFVLWPVAARRPRLARPLAGITLGMLTGYVASSAALNAYLRVVDYHFEQPSDAGYAPVIGATAGAVVGLALGLLANRYARPTTTVLGVALGLLGGEAAAEALQFQIVHYRHEDPGAHHVYFQLGFCGAGVVGGLVLGVLAHRHPLRSRPGFGALAGAFIGVTLPGLALGMPPLETVTVCAAVGAVIATRRPSSTWRLVPAGGGLHRTALSVRTLAGELRPGAFTQGLITAAAAIAVDDRRQERYAEEFRATLAEITGPLAAPRRLWCALTILANAAALRIELRQAPETENEVDAADEDADETESLT
ncbi:hypothetical protein CcI49_20445 [Frankia sp. CcI49]|uniref:hypothetical protein n=1 Tax=Frankia sp. CcI49 TaxID=1745382 RepID=UPI000975B290|nr:hypothetical protein [Frankia sp. CcI49]ONH58604.1 hypothetical protein CcI49_20445 [Frankia sp. CcI49]